MLETGIFDRRQLARSIDKSGQLIEAARAYLARGATKIADVATHGVLPGDSLKRLQESGCFEKIVVTDSPPRAIELQSDFLEVISCADLLSKSLNI